MGGRARPPRRTFPSRGSPRRWGVAQEATAPRWSPAGPQELPKAPACPLGPPESSDTWAHTGGRAAAIQPANFLAAAPSGPGARQGWSRLVRAEGVRTCERSAPLASLPAPVSVLLPKFLWGQTLGVAISRVRVFLFLLLSHSLFFCFHSASLPLSLDSCVLQCCPPGPPPHPAYAAAGFQGAHLGCRPCDPQSSLRAS